MSRCFALTGGIRSTKPCRNNASILSRTTDTDGTEVITYRYTCKSHKNFFDNKETQLQRWFTVIKPFPWHEGDRVICYLSRLEFSSSRRLYIERCLQHKLIVPTQDKFKVFVGLSGRHYAMFMVLCAKYIEEFSLTWVPSIKFWEEVFMTLWKWSMSIGPVYISNQDTVRLCCRNDDLEYFGLAVRCYFKRLADVREVNDWSEGYRYLCSTGFDLSKNWALRYCMTVNPDNIEKEYGVPQGVVDNLCSWWLTRWKKDTEKKLEKVKEELLEVVLAPGFTPESVMAWDDAKQLREVWRRV